MRMSFTDRAIALLYLAVAVVATTGCHTTASGRDDVRLAADRPVAPDIPIPQGARLIDRSSEDHTSGARRVYLRHEYECKADKYRVREFYRRQMPAARWRLVSDTNIKGEITMRFEKATEACVIRLIQERRAFSRPCCIRVIVSPIENSEPPPTARNTP